jgi:predicted O-methyltransferase YrrM
MTTGEKNASAADEVLAQIEKTAKNQSLPIVGPYKGEILAKEIRKAKPKNVLEVGTLIGYSAIIMGKELGENSKIVTIEEHPDNAKLSRENIIRAKIPPKIEVITGNALEVIPKLKGFFDFVFIDAKKSEYAQYLKLTEEKLQKKALIIADNAGIFADEMSDYLDYVRNSSKYMSRYVQVGEDGLEISVKL